CATGSTCSTTARPSTSCSGGDATARSTTSAAATRWRTSSSPGRSCASPPGRTRSSGPWPTGRATTAVTPWIPRRSGSSAGRRAGSGVIFDARGYVVTVSYLVVDAQTIEAQLRDGRMVPALPAGIDLETGLAVVRLAGAGPWPAASLGDSRDVVTGARTGTVGMDEDDDLVHAASTIEGGRRFSAAWEDM